MKLYFQSYPLILLMCFVFVLCIGVSSVHAQYLKAFVGTGYPDIADGANRAVVEALELAVSRMELNWHEQRLRV